MSALKGHPEDMSSPGLISFGYVGVSVKIEWFIAILVQFSVFKNLNCMR